MMKKILFLFLVLSLIGCNYKIINKPGLHGRIKEYTDYNICIESIGNDSIIKDTISVRRNKLNRNGNLVKFEFLNLHSNSTYSNTNIYNSEGRIIKEIGKFDDNKVVVNYIYKDTLLQKIYSKQKIDNNILELNERYFYNKQGKLFKTIMSNIILDNNDTVSSDIFINKYDSNNLLSQSLIIMNSAFDSTEKTFCKYEYEDSGLLNKTFEYNEDNKLTKTKVYKYIFDKNGSWTEKREFDNDTLVYITSRIIEYQ